MQSKEIRIGVLCRGSNSFVKYKQYFLFIGYRIYNPLLHLTKINPCDSAHASMVSVLRSLTTLTSVNVNQDSLVKTVKQVSM